MGLSTQERILLADDHPLFRAALLAAVQRLPGDIDTAEVDSLGATQTALREAPASLVCLDLHMSDSSGFLGLTELRREFPATPVVVVSASDAPGVAQRAVEFGASGFIPKTADLDTICEALAAVRDGEIWLPEDLDEGDDDSVDHAALLATLTPAQLRVLEGLASGRLNKQIAYEMDISIATVKAHVTAIFRKLGVINRTQAVLIAQSLFVEPAKV
ncbi:MAG: response regulator transcription factor [Alphaproteobacteria bacterium]|nr:response regulator transcription factor [Alphaproteobacteria bacterium]